MFIKVPFTMVRTQKQPKGPSSEGWIKQLGYIYTVEKYSTIQRNKIVIFAEMWTDLETE